MSFDDNDDWEDPFDNDDDPPNYLPNEDICEIGFFEYEHGNDNNNPWTNDVEHFMKDHLTYVLGCHVLLKNEDNIYNLFHGTSILLKTFYEFPLSNILSYLRWYTYEQEGSFTMIPPPLTIKLHILQLFVKIIQEEPFTFETTIVIKTIWISLIQRHWKKILKQRKDILLKMKTYTFLALRERNRFSFLTKYFHPLKHSLKGMLSVYKK
jgi:hypothetical protein